jgi:hypothetical protein
MFLPEGPYPPSPSGISTWFGGFLAFLVTRIVDDPGCAITRSGGWFPRAMPGLKPVSLGVPLFQHNRCDKHSLNNRVTQPDLINGNTLPLLG